MKKPIFRLRGVRQRGMALIDPIHGRMSGKLGGVVYGNNAGGAYVRVLVNPTNPNTPFQQAIRSATSQLTSRWVATLSAAQRAAWATYAANVTVPNRWGTPIHLNPLAMYVRCNVPRIQWLGATKIVDDAPVIFNLGEYTEPSVLVNLINSCDVTFGVGDDWVDEDDSHMFVYGSRQQNISKVFFKGPYRPCGASIAGNSVTPETSPATINIPFTATNGNRMFFFIRVSRADGRLSAPWRGYSDVTIP